MSDKDVKPNQANMPALQSGRLQDAPKVFREFIFNVPHGTPPDTVLQESYYRHHWDRLHPMDVVTAFAEDGTWERRLRVMFSSKAGVQVSPLGPIISHVNREVLGDGEYDVKYVAPSVKWCIIRKADNKRVKEHFISEDAAQRALLEMKKAA